MYSHDGLKDSLTSLAAPPFFYEELRRGLSRVARGGGHLSLIRLVLSAYTEHDVEDTMTSPDDLEIVRFANILVRLSRVEDLCARIGEKEFVVLLYASEFVAQSYIKRISRQWQTSSAMIEMEKRVLNLRLSSSYLTSHPGQSVLELLENLDHAPLSGGCL